MTYNGWTNRETWLVNEYFGETFSYLGADEYLSPTQLRAGVEESFVRSKMTELEHEFVTLAMARADWEELAEAYQPETFLIDEC